MTDTNHGARGPALGYYYQAIYALIKLFSSKNDNAFVSIETFDDVYHDDGGKKELIQLKHSITKNTKISIKSKELWKTIKVWCDFLLTNDPKDGTFTLATVASLDPESSLNSLTTANSSRLQLENDLLSEASRVKKERDEIEEENKIRLSQKQKEKTLPHENRYKGCEAFIKLAPKKRNDLITNINLVVDSFTIDNAKEKVIEYIRFNTQPNNHESLIESIIAWWDREAVRSLTRERDECIHFSELQEFIARKNSELYHDGFTDDLDEMDIPEVKNPNKIQSQQLEIIKATKTQKRRSYDTEIKARIQRKKWMDDNLPASSKLTNYDNLLTKEWSYQFEEMNDNATNYDEKEKEEKGRKLLDWSHQVAHVQVKPISKNYSNPDLVRGSYQMLSTTKKVGWHCDYNFLIKSPKK
ncbi:ABC-three component system protein [Desulfotalea psychrophila]|uniref:ABC-three component systems C-terminal domain-containing protein n=1 Tax=Desulfotalea psychrophila (strain LSv54 / DSM 12343) TaxID=177439 RepID=Q6AQN3_DESPS|nr:ABC-three component system protein [Desulfotalea psychrophila]CAG35340.1 hypothetical protein DP0611 [Desulfotalea psychrophila LSv54]